METTSQIFIYHKHNLNNIFVHYCKQQNTPVRALDTCSNQHPSDSLIEGQLVESFPTSLTILGISICSNPPSRSLVSVPCVSDISINGSPHSSAKTLTTLFLPLDELPTTRQGQPCETHVATLSRALHCVLRKCVVPTESSF